MALSTRLMFSVSVFVLLFGKCCIIVKTWRNRKVKLFIEKHKQLLPCHLFVEPVHCAKYHPVCQWCPIPYRNMSEFVFVCVCVSITSPPRDKISEIATSKCYCSMTRF